MGKALTPEEKALQKAEQAQERQAQKGFYEMLRKAHAKGALVEVKLPDGIRLEDILAGQNPK